MLLSERLRITPFLKILPCFAAGIFAFGYVTAPDWVIVSATITCYLLAWALRKSVWGGCYSAVALFMCGILVTAIAATREVMPRGVRLAMVLEVNDTPVTQGRWQRTTADVGSFRRTDAAAGTWTPTDERIELRVDTSMRVAVGDQLCVTGYLNPLDTTGSRYGRLMRSRGISARTYVVENGIVVCLEGNGRRLIRTASMFHQAAVERIAQLNIDDADKDMVSALVAGEKRAFDPRLKEEYSRTGVAHILAVSGLHMGFVLIIANILFGWLVLFRRGHILKKRAGHLGVVALCGHGGAFAISGPCSAHVFGRTTRICLLCGRWRVQYRSGCSHADARYPSVLSLRCEFPALICGGAVDPLLLSTHVSSAVVPQQAVGCFVELASARRRGSNRNAADCSV